jgi:WD40 repeat protein
LSPAPRAENPPRARPGGSTPRLRKATDDALGHNRNSFDFTPKLTDFGLAKHTDSEGTQTETVTLAGTVPYMAPEQAAGRRDEIGFPTDVYALGVTLFELLTRRKPFEGDTAADTLRRIVSEEPASLRRLRPDLPRDLEAICVRCLERAPSKRYLTASALAEDLTRFLEGRPTHARPVGPMGHAVKWSRRNRGWAAAIALFLVAGTALPAAAVWSARSQAEEQRRAGILQQLQNVRLAPHRVTKITNWLDDGLAGVREAATIRTDGTLRDQAAAFLSGPTAHLNKWMSGFLASSIAFDAAGRRVLIGGSDADEAKIWDSQTDEIVQTSGLAGNGPVLFRPNGDAWQVVVSPRDPRALRLWSVDKRETVRELRIPEKPVAPSTEARAPTEFRIEQIVLTPEGHFAAASARTKAATALITVWDAEHGKTIRQIETADRKVTAIALSPDGRLLAAGDEKGRLVLWTLPEGAEISVASAGSSRLNCLAFGRSVRQQFNPDRTARWLLAGGDAAGRVTVWDLGRRAPRTYCQGTYYDIAALAFCPDGTTLASTGRVNSTLWDIATGRPLVEVQCSDNMTGLAISPDGRKLACSMHQLQHPPELAHEGLQVWDLEYERGIQNLRGLESPIAHTKVQFSDDGSRVAALSIDWRVAIWDRRTGFLQSVFDVTPGLTADNTGLAFSHDGRKLAVSVGHEARMWDLQTGQSKAWRLPEGLVDALAFDATDTHLYLLRMETSDRHRAPDNNSPIRSYPRVCRVRDLLAAPAHDRVATPPNAVNPVLGTKKGADPLPNGHTMRRGIVGQGSVPFFVPTLWQTDFFDGGIFKTQASRDGRYFFVLGDHGREQRERYVKVFDVPSGKELLSWPSTDFQLEATSGLLAVYLGKAGAGTYCLVKCPSGELLETLERGPIAIGPGGRLLAFNLSDSFGFALSRREGKRPAASPLHLVTLGIDLMAAEGRPTFSSDGTLLAWGNQNGTVSVCDIPEIQRRLAGLGLGF